jgi:hypothetical protein
MLSYARHWKSMAVVGTLAFFTATPVCAREPAAVWFAPDPDTPDFIDLFTKPQLWPKARQRADVFLLGPEQLFSRADLTNDLATLQGVDAYRKMQQWNMDIAIDAPSIKPWDCTGQGGRAKDPRVTGKSEGAASGMKRRSGLSGALHVPGRLSSAQRHRCIRIPRHNEHDRRHHRPRTGAETS